MMFTMFYMFPFVSVFVAGSHDKQMRPSGHVDLDLMFKVVEESTLQFDLEVDPNAAELKPSETRFFGIFVS